MSAVRLLSATLAVGVVPGALATMLCRPRPQLTGLETIGFGIALSFGIVQLATITALSLHSSPAATVGVIAVASILMAGCVVASPSRRLSIVLTLDELIVLSLLVALSLFLYNLGSPVNWYEDQVHVAIVRRLAALESPRLDNLYVTPGVLYTYPFPGTHYFMALVAKLSDLDSLFVYHKLRFFWGPAALVMLHLAARAVFGARGIASGVSVTAIALVCAGTFAMVPGFDSGWAQLVPYSHASDVAMTVLLPALLICAFGYLLAEVERERFFFLAATVMLVLMLVMVHIREAVQFTAYIACFLLVTVASRQFRAYARRAAVLFVATAALAVIYTLWQAQVAGIVSDIVQTHRARLASIVSEASLRALVATPAPVLLSDFVINSDQVSEGLTPLLLFVGPAVLLLFSRQPLVWLVSASTVVYLAVMTVPLLAIPYIYTTYFEILYTPVRNVIFFAYLFSGAVIYTTIVALARIDRTRLSLLAAGTLAGVLALLVSLCLNRSAVGFFAPLIASYGLAFTLLWAPPMRAKPLRAAIAVLLTVASLIMLFPEREAVPLVSNVSVRWLEGLPEAQRLALERQFSLTAGEPNSNYSETVNVWNYAIADTSPENIKALVNHPQVVDTNDIDRNRFSVPRRPAERDHQYVGVARLAWLQPPDPLLFGITAALVWALGFIAPLALSSLRGRRVAASLELATDEPFYRRVFAYTLFVIPFALLTARPTLSPLMAGPPHPGGRADTPNSMIGRTSCVTTPGVALPFARDEVASSERTSCPPDFGVVEWVRTHVPADAIFAVDRWSAPAPQVFMPQQAVVFPASDAAFINQRELFGIYEKFFGDRMRQYGAQPFFNIFETPTERLAFVDALGVTHVLINPPHYVGVRAALDALPDQFARRYDQGGWAVYEVTRKSRVGASR